MGAVAEIEIAAERTIPIGGRDGEYQYFVNLAEADVDGEAPVYRFYHDDASLYWQAATFERHLSALVSRAIRRGTEALMS